jgi:hypothetical protein
MYALGLTGDPEAVRVLKELARAESNYERLRPVVYALVLAGDSGEVALQELIATTKPNLGMLIRRMRLGAAPWHERSRRLDFPFPDMPAEIRLPETCSHAGRNGGWVCSTAPQ